MTYEQNFLLAAGGDFQGTIKTDIPTGMDVNDESVSDDVMTER